jgi:YegS/Rv2252/BmrU family lipid kinase
MLSLIVNPSAGGGRTGKALPAVQAALEGFGIAHHVEPTRSLEHAQELAVAAVGRSEVAVAFGGDGLIGAVAGALNGTQGVLGVLPGGRGNDFARCLNIPLEPAAACSVLAGGHTTEVDLGSADGRTFLGIATCGFDAEANRVANDARIIRGNLVYAYGGIRALLAWKPEDFRVLLDGQEVNFHGYTVAVANSPRHGGGMLLAPEAALNDGMFDVVMISDAPKLKFLRQLPRVFDGRHVGSPYVRIVKARDVEIHASRPGTMYADGDPVAVLPAKLSVIPHAVRVMVPAQ